MPQNSCSFKEEGGGGISKSTTKVLGGSSAKTGVGEQFDQEEGKGEVASGRTRVHLVAGGGGVR